MKICYLINTHAGYLKPLIRLLETMDGRVDLADIWIVSGGNRIAGIPQLGKFRGAHLIEVEHDSWDYTGLIELVMMPPGGYPYFSNYTHVFCLQDTMECGARTHELVSAADPEKWATAAFGGQCNLVLYQKEYLLTMREFILQRRNSSKLDSINHEGALWKMLTQNLSRRHEATFAPGTHEVVGSEMPYSDVVRIKEYYAGVDIVKWKANYGQNMHALVTRP